MGGVTFHQLIQDLYENKTEKTKSNLFVDIKPLISNFHSDPIPSRSKGRITDFNFWHWYPNGIKHCICCIVKLFSRNKISVACSSVINGTETLKIKPDYFSSAPSRTEKIRHQMLECCRNDHDSERNSRIRTSVHLNTFGETRRTTEEKLTVSVLHLQVELSQSVC